jgi:two-component system nitrogen regulation response regulator NtrX
MAQILIVDDEKDVAQSLSAILKDEGHRTTLAGSGAEAKEKIKNHIFDLVILDIWLPDGEGDDFLKEIHQDSPDLPVIMISGHANVATAVKCLHLGALDFIEKPLSIEKILSSVQNSIKIKRLEVENRTLKSKVSQDYKLLGKSSIMEEIRRLISIVAPKNATVLITGENGTGKENVARQIYQSSSRNHKPFIAINCAAIPEDLIESELFGYDKGAFTGAISSKKGKFELAHEGTLFLDEIGDMSLKTQSKVLRVIQEQSIERLGSDSSIEIDVRIIAATNKDLEKRIQEGLFREDLYYRLSVIPMKIPPLRERKEDILFIAQHYLEYFCKEFGISLKKFSPQAEIRIKEYTWPGNIRELKNLMERLSIVVSSEVIEEEDLPLLSFKSTSPLANNFREARSHFEKVFLKEKLQICGHNISKTAELVGLERSYLSKKLKLYGMESED